MNYQTIKKLQEGYGYDQLQSMIDSGQVWKLNGSYGRMAMSSLESGMCMLPKEACFDYYGNRVPSRDDLKKGTKGTFQNCSRFWSGVEDGSIFLELNREQII
jgi:hypothetical protein